MNQDREGKVDRSDDMEIKGPLGWSVRASGRIVTLVLVAVGLAAMGVWHDYKSTVQNTAIIDELRNVAYVLTLSEAERRRLNLSIPESLRTRMERDRTGPRSHDQGR